MLKQTTLKLSLSIFLNALGAALLCVIIVMTFGAIGSKSSSDSSSSSSLTSSYSSNSSSASSVTSNSENATSTSSSTSSSMMTEKIEISTGGLIENPVGKIILGLISNLIVFGLVYSACWNEGSRDPNRIKYGHMDKFMLKGLVAGAIAIIPLIIYTIIFLIFKINNPDITATTVMEIIYRLLNMGFVVYGDGWIGNPVASFAVLLIYPLTSTLGYFAGFKQFQIMPKLVYKDNGKPKNKRQQKYYDNLKK